MRSAAPARSACVALRSLRAPETASLFRPSGPSPCDTELAVRGERRRLLAALALACWPVQAASLALHGKVEPPLERGVAAVSAVESPFYLEVPVRHSAFQFRSLEPGAYTLTVMDPRWGVTRKTVQVTPSFADSKGRVRVEVNLDRSDSSRSRRVEGRSTVSVAALKVSPKARSAVRRARARLGRGDEAGAIELLLRAVEISPSFAEVWNELGTIAYKARSLDVAEERFRKALEYEPLAYAPMVNLGGTLLSQGRYDEALSFNLMARSMQPGDALANSQLGMNFFYKGQFGKAKEYLLRAKEADASHFSNPQLFLAEIHAREGDLELARAELEDFLRRHPDDRAAAIARDAMLQLDARSATR